MMVAVCGASDEVFRYMVMKKVLTPPTKYFIDHFHLMIILRFILIPPQPY